MITLLHFNGARKAPLDDWSAAAGLSLFGEGGEAMLGVLVGARPLIVTNRVDEEDGADRGSC